MPPCAGTANPCSKIRACAFLPSIALLCLTTSAFAASTLSGVVTNKTTNKPSPRRRSHPHPPSAGHAGSRPHPRQTPRGQFKLDVADDGVHLVRVTHDKGQLLPPRPARSRLRRGRSLQRRRQGRRRVTGEADVLRIQSDPGGSGLRVVENFFVKNDSNPPRTQFSDRPFEFYLPAGAVVQGSAALGPGGMPVQAAPRPVRRHPQPLRLRLPHPSRRDPLPDHLQHPLQRLFQVRSPGQASQPTPSPS